MTGVAKKTVMRLLVEIGAVCSRYQDEAFRNLNCRRLQVDELWQFVGAKQKNLTPENIARGAVGDTWLWVAIDAETKIVPSWLLGDRSAESARDFIADLAGRLKSRIQLTSDGLRVYVDAVEQAFGASVDFAMLIKTYTNDREGEIRYSPAECTGTRTVRVIGTPDEQHISTSFVERQNLSVRMTNRRYTRLTNGFSKKLENHAASIALGYFAYNFIKIHRTLRTSPAMAAGVANRLWDVSDLVALWEAEERRLERAA
jgi:IS1 family transposase